QDRRRPSSSPRAFSSSRRSRSAAEARWVSICLCRSSSSPACARPPSAAASAIAPTALHHLPHVLLPHHLRDAKLVIEFPDDLKPRVLQVQEGPAVVRW